MEAVKKRAELEERVRALEEERRRVLAEITALKSSRRLEGGVARLGLNEHQRAIYRILEAKRRVSSGRLYGEYRKLVPEPVGPRAYRSYLARMVELGLVRAVRGRRGRRYEVI